MADYPIPATFEDIAAAAPPPAQQAPVMAPPSMVQGSSPGWGDTIKRLIPFVFAGIAGAKGGRVASGAMLNGIASSIAHQQQQAAIQAKMAADAATTEQERRLRIAEFVQRSTAQRNAFVQDAIKTVEGLEPSKQPYYRSMYDKAGEQAYGLPPGWLSQAPNATGPSKQDVAAAKDQLATLEKSLSAQGYTLDEALAARPDLAVKQPDGTSIPVTQIRVTAGGAMEGGPLPTKAQAGPKTEFQHYFDTVALPAFADAQHTQASALTPAQRNDAMLQAKASWESAGKSTGTSEYDSFLKDALIVKAEKLYGVGATPDKLTAAERKAANLEARQQWAQAGKVDTSGEGMPQSFSPVDASPPDPRTANTPDPKIGGMTPNALYQQAVLFALKGNMTGMRSGSKGPLLLQMTAIRNKAGALAAAAGTDLGTLQQQYKAAGGTLDKLTERLAFTSAANNNGIADLELVDKQSANVPRTGSPLANRYIQWANGQVLTGNPELTRLEVYIYAASREYARVATGANSGALLSDTATREASRLLNAAQTPEALLAATQAMRDDMRNNVTSYADEIGKTNRTIRDFLLVTNGIDPGAAGGGAGVTPPPAGGLTTMRPAPSHVAAAGFTRMQKPDGTLIDVPNANVEKAKALGAVIKVMPQDPFAALGAQPVAQDPFAALGAIPVTPAVSHVPRTARDLNQPIIPTDPTSLVTSMAARGASDQVTYWLENAKDVARSLLNVGKAPVAMLKQLYEDVSHAGPMENAFPGGPAAASLAKQLTQAQLAQFNKAKAAYDLGHYSEAAAYTLAGVLPIAGPVAAGAGEKIVAGHPAEAATDLALLASPLLMKAHGNVPVTQTTTRPIMQHPNPAVREAVQFGQERGIPVDLGTATGNRAIQGVRALSDTSPLGASVAGKAREATTQALARTGEDLAQQTASASGTPETAGGAVTGALQAKIQDLHGAANTAYQAVRDLEAKAQSVPPTFKTAVTPARDFSAAAAEPGFAYHATSAENAADILSSGKLKPHRPSFGTDQSAWPDGATASRSYFTAGGGKVASSFAPAEGTPVLLRVATKDAPMTAESGTGDLYTTKNIPAGKIEVLSSGGQWVPLEKLSSPPVAASIVDVRAAKQVFAPLLDRIERQWTVVQKESSPALPAMRELVNGPDFAPLSEVDRNLGALKGLARGAAMPELRDVSQGLAAKAVSELEQAVQAAARRLGPEGPTSLAAGRTATAAKYQTADLLQQLSDEPVKAFTRLMAPKDAASAQLSAVIDSVPEVAPLLGRAYLDDVLAQATGPEGSWAKAYTAWQKLGPTTRGLVFKDAAYVKDLDRFFLLAKKLAENPNPSGTATVGQLAMAGSWAIRDPVGAGTYVLGSGALSKAIHSPTVVRLLTQTATLPRLNVRATVGVLPALSVALEQAGVDVTGFPKGPAMVPSHAAGLQPMTPVPSHTRR